MLFIYFFFFKQKTAYEMRISDWSSDVCSSDLPSAAPAGAAKGNADAFCLQQRLAHRRQIGRGRIHAWRGFGKRAGVIGGRRGEQPCGRPLLHHATRSEEHTSELQSLMRLSYDVF